MNSISRSARPIGFRLIALLLTLFVFTAACGDDDDVSTGDPSDESSDETGAETDDDAGDDDTSMPDGHCAIVSADDVAAAAGIEVTDTVESTGTGSLQDIEYSTIGCHYEVADGGHVSIAVLTDEAGTQLGSDVYEDLRAESEARRADTYPHEEVDLGVRAFFQASLGPADALFIDAGPSGVIQIQDHRKLSLDREALTAVGEVAVTAYS